MYVVTRNGRYFVGWPRWTATWSNKASDAEVFKEAWVASRVARWFNAYVQRASKKKGKKSNVS